LEVIFGGAQMLHVRAFALLIAFAATSAHADTEGSLGESEVAAALSAIERRCPADVPSAIGPAIQAMNEYVRQAGGMVISDFRTLGVSEVYRSLLELNPHTDESMLARAAVEGMRGGVEPHTPSDDAYVEMISCNCTAGIGVEAYLDNGRPKVVRPISGSPAERAGITAGDRILAIDGADTEGWPLARVVRALQGPPRSTVSLVLSRGSASELIDLQLQREIVRVRSVDWRRDGNIGIISVHQFAEGTGALVRTAIRDLRPAAGYVLDLRGNPGGLLDQAIEVADLFLDGGLIVSVLSAQECPPRQTATYHARRGDETRGSPVVVLVDSRTASGAELLAAALLDRGRAAIVGQRTFANGSVNTVIPISIRAGIRLTTGEMTSPTGRRLSEGVTPTHVTLDVAANQDLAVQRAMEVLMGN
jgi:carboxyl-terminal processing protease